MSKIDQLIAVFKEVKEELNKNMNGAMAPGSNMKPNSTTGTSGGQGGMYRSEMDKNCAPPATMNLSEDGSMEKQMISASPGGAQDMHMIKCGANGQWRMDKIDEPHKDDPHHEAKEMKIAKDIKAKAKKLEGMHKTDQLADDIIEKLEKSAFKRLQHKIEGEGHSKESAGAITAAIGRKELGQKEMTARSKAGMHKEDDNYISRDGKNREANPKLRQSDLGPGGRVRMIKDEGTNSEAASSKPHNKGEFKVMPMEPETSVKHLEAKGLPYSGKDKDVKKDEHCSKCGHTPCECMDKGDRKGHIQGNDVRGNDENKAPGRGTLSV
jgi:hypothetical protein